MDALTLLNIGLAIVNLVVALFQGWKEWHQRRHSGHPLEAALRDVALAIREQGSA